MGAAHELLKLRRQRPHRRLDHTASHQTELRASGDGPKTKKITIMTTVPPGAVRPDVHRKLQLRPYGALSQKLRTTS